MRCSQLAVVALASLLGLGLGPGLAAAASCSNSGLPGTPYQGYGASTPGGAGQALYRVTSRADAGPGSLRAALAAGKRCIVFDVAGDIVLMRQIYVEGSFVTVDGFSAPAPGITVRNYGISLWGSTGAHDVILRGLRFRNAGQPSCAAGDCWDGIQIKNGAARIVVDHVSIDNASDGALDIAGSHDITVQWSLLSGTTAQSLLQRSSRMTMHHNLFVNGQNRNPQAEWDTTLATRPPGTVLDLRNNLLWGYSAYGTIVRGNATANVVNNYYHSPTRPNAGQALIVDTHGRVHAAGNRAPSGADVDGVGTERQAFSAASVTTTDACRAAEQVQDGAGARGEDLTADAVDRKHLAGLPSAQLPGCAPSSSVATPAVSPSSPSMSPSTSPSTSTRKADLVMTSLAMPVTLRRGQGFAIQFGVSNRGTAAAPVSRVKIYLSTDASPSANDLLLRSRSIAALGPGASQSHALTEVIPSSVKPGSYYVVLVIDQEGAVSESNESNNITKTAATVR